jgi:hypothetical protein
MLLAPRHFVQFLDGRHGDVAIIARVPGDLGAHINAYTMELRIGLNYARKLLIRHHLRYEHFEMIQPAIEHGYAGVDRGNLLFFLYDDLRFHSIFRLVVKTAAGGSELWLKTFHRCKAQQVKNSLRRMNVLKMHRR